MSEINFIPNAFTGEEETCPVCIARYSLEKALSLEESALEKMGIKLITTDGISKEIAETYAELQQSFRSLITEYRVSFAINLAIWFSAERFGRTKKVPDLILAYEEYRNQSLLAFQSYYQAHSSFMTELQNTQSNSSLNIEQLELLSSHQSLVPVVDNFWTTVDNWTIKRREECFMVL